MVSLGFPGLWWIWFKLGCKTWPCYLSESKHGSPRPRVHWTERLPCGVIHHKPIFKLTKRVKKLILVLPSLCESQPLGLGPDWSRSLSLTYSTYVLFSGTLTNVIPSYSANREGPRVCLARPESLSRLSTISKRGGLRGGAHNTQ